MKDFDSWCKSLENSVDDIEYSSHEDTQERLTIADLSKDITENQSSSDEPYTGFKIQDKETGEWIPCGGLSMPNYPIVHTGQQYKPCGDDCKRARQHVCDEYGNGE